MSQNMREGFPFEYLAEHMRACMANLNHLELHNSTFDLKVMSRALAEARNLRSLSIQLDFTQVYYNQGDLFLNDGSPGKPNLNTILPLCASTLEDLTLVIYYCPFNLLAEEYSFSRRGHVLTCLGQMTRLRSLRTNFRSLLGHPWLAKGESPLIDSETGFDEYDINTLVAAAGEIRLPASLRKLVLIEERDARFFSRSQPAMFFLVQRDLCAQANIYSEMLKRLAAACAKGKKSHEWGLREVTVLSWYPQDEDDVVAALLDRSGVEEAFAQVPGLKFDWGRIDVSEMSPRQTWFS